MERRKISVGIWVIVSFQLIAWVFGVVHGAEQYPNKPIRLICPMGPGSANDTLCRMLQDPLSKTLGVPVVVENKVGGGGAIAGDYVAKSRPDGYTLFSGHAGAMVIIPIITPDTFKVEDFALVCKAMEAPMVLSVKADSPFKTLENMLDFARQNPGKLVYGCAGHGSSTYFGMETLKLKAGVNVTFLPLTAGTTNLAALLGGHVDMINDSFATQRGLIESGQIRPLVVVPKTRLLPDVPSYAEKGFPEVPDAGWTSYFVPKGTSGVIVQKLSQAFETAINSPSVIGQAQKLGIVLDFVRAEDFSNQISTLYKRVEEIAKRVGLAK